MEAMRTVFIFIGGTIFGSFYYTLALRTASGELRESWKKALFTSSRCPRCGAGIGGAYLVPLIGYLAAKGRCRSCGAGISPAYPFMEALYGFLALALYFTFGLSIYFAAVFLLAGLALCISIVDVKTMTIPNPLIAAFGLLSLYPVVLTNSPLESLYGLLLMSGFFITVLLIFPDSFGGGDVKFAAAIGLFLGLELAVVALEASLISGAIVGIVYAVKTGKGLRSRIPFGPFLFIGMMTAIVYGREILVLYYKWFF